MSTDKKTEMKQKLAGSRMGLRQLLSSLTPEQWQKTVFSEDNSWTVAEIVAHLIDSEGGMSVQVHKIRTGRVTVPDGFDLDRWNAGLRKRLAEDSLTPQALMQALAKTRVKTLEVLDSLEDEQFALEGRHPGRGVISIEQYYETISGHEVMHGRDIKKALGIG